MNIDIIKLNGSYLTIILSGEYSNKDIYELPETILKIYEAHKHDNILLDTTQIENRLINSMIEYECGEKLASHLNGYGIKLGIYGNDEIFSDFLEIVTANHDVDIKVSNDREELISWF
jgi:hypothetical protein